MILSCSPFGVQWKALGLSDRWLIMAQGQQKADASPEMRRISRVKSEKTHRTRNGRTTKPHVIETTEQQLNNTSVQSRNRGQLNSGNKTGTTRSSV